MNQRLVAACVALPLVFGLLIYAGLARLPYATYKPGGTLDVLGEDQNDAEIVQVLGRKTYRDDEGQLRMTTVAVSPAQQRDDRGLSLVELLGTWLDSDDAVYPYLAVHPDDETEESSREEGAAQMATSQDDAVAGRARSSSATTCRRCSRSPRSARTRRPTACCGSTTGCSPSTARRCRATPTWPTTRSCAPSSASHRRASR